MTDVETASPTLFRLYGVAVLALLFGYATAIPNIQAGIFPWAIVIMGAISNGGAALFLVRDSSIWGRRILIVIFGGIFLALIASMAFPSSP